METDREIDMCISLYIRIYIYIHIYTYVQIHMYNYITCIYIHTHTYAYMQHINDAHIYIQLHHSFRFPMRHCKGFLFLPSKARPQL